MRGKYWSIAGIVLIGALIIQAGAFAKGYSIQTTSQTPKIEKRKTILDSILISYHPLFSYRSLRVFIDEKQREPRGKIYGENITLSAHIAKDAEFVKLFVHELAHYIDIYFLVQTRLASDPSESFYSISWEKPTVKKSSEGIRSFVSGYAATNQYEDFAESFTFYVFHNEYFADKALRNESLRQKYLFFSEYLFRDGEFIGTDFSLSKVPDYVFDTTKVPILLQKYLYSLK